MQTDPLIRDVGISIIGAASVAIPAYLLRIPLILAYLLAGIVLGPHLGFRIIENAESISTLSSIGLILLMFILGIEIDIRKLAQAGRSVVLSGIAQFIGCSVLGWLFFKTFHGEGATRFELLYLMIASSLSSTLIVVKILSDRLEIDSLNSRITLGILLLQDLWAIVFLAVQPNFSNLSPLILIESLTKAAALIFSGLLLAKYILPKIFSLVGKLPELMIVVAMSWCFGMCGLAKILNLSLEMGALVAGVSIASYPYHVDVAAKISGLRDFFITLFFVSLGLQIPQPTGNVLGLTFLIVCFALFSRVLTVFPSLHLLKYGNRTSLLASLNLSQVSEFSIVLAALGVQYGQVSSDILSSFILALVITALFSSFVIPNGHAIYKWLNPILNKFGLDDRLEVEGGKIPETDSKDLVRIVILGFYRDASSLLAELMKRHDEPYLKALLILDFNPEAHQKLKSMGLNCRYADLGHTETLNKIDLSRATQILCTLTDNQLKGTSNLKLLKFLKEHAPTAQLIFSSDSLEGARELYRNGADYVYLPRLVGAYYMADVMERLGAGPNQTIREEAIRFLEKWNEVIP